MGKEFHIKGGERILAMIRKFSATEKVIFGTFVVIALVSALSLAWSVDKAFLMPIPAHGGRLAEGIVGLPRSINPILAFTDVDKDLSNLVYSGLMKYENGKLVSDLAKSYTVSDDGLVYDFKLKDDLRFHDGVPVTSDDVEFTIQKVEDTVIKSPRRADWANITVKKISPTEIQFVLKQPYAPFLTNTTLGIIPKHIWSKVDADQFIFSQYNIEPVGSGPYKLDSIQRDSGGIPIYYTLSSFSRYDDGEAYISQFIMYFFPNEKAMIDAYSKGIVESMARISPREAAAIASTTPSAQILHVPLSRVFGIFFNQNQAPLFAQAEVRQALNIATDKEQIVRQVLFGYGVVSNDPIPSNFSTIKNSGANSTKSSLDIDGANSLLSKNGWVMNSDGIAEKKDKKGGVQKLEFSIATADSPDLKQAAEIIKEQWTKIGAHVTIKVFESGDLYQNVIATRKYDVLLFGESIGKDLDLYAFWHSSQRNAPGLNVAMYVNSKVDKLLEDARTTSDASAKAGLYTQFQKIIQSEVPAIFLYSPEFIYIVPEKVHEVSLQDVTSPSERFDNINTWYVTTDNVWKLFGNQEKSTVETTATSTQQ